MDDVGAIDTSTIPCVGGSVRCLDEVGMGHAFFGVDSAGLVEGLKEVFDRDSLVVTASGGVEADAKDFTNGFKWRLEGAVGVDDDEPQRPTLRRTSCMKTRAASSA